MFASRYTPCELCGESVDQTAPNRHSCSPERRAAFQMLALRDDIAHFEDRFWEYVDSALGRFEVWLAAKELREAR